MSQMIELVDSYNAGMKAMEEKRWYDAAKHFVRVEDIADNGDLYEELCIADSYEKEIQKYWWELYQLMTKQQRREIKRLRHDYIPQCNNNSSRIWF